MKNRGNLLLSIVIIHYNRVEHLKSTISSLSRVVGYNNFEIIVADDFSERPIRQQLLDIKCDLAVFNYSNRGLGFNTNNALKLCRGQYILQLQDDWDFCGFETVLLESIELFKKDASIELVRFYNQKLYPTKPYNNKNYVIIDRDQLIEQQHKTLYSDTPHLKSNNFHNKYGFFKEGVPMTEMEIEFATNFAKYSSGSIIFSASDQFVHTGADNSFNPSKKKTRIYKKLSRVHLLKKIMDLYFHNKNK